MIVPGDPDDNRRAKPDAALADALMAAAIMHQQGKFKVAQAEGQGGILMSPPTPPTASAFGQPSDLGNYIRENGEHRINPLWDGWSTANKKLLNNLPNDLEMIYDDGSPWKAKGAKRGESVIIRPKGGRDVPVS